jgi:hypothetical protein
VLPAVLEGPALRDLGALHGVETLVGVVLVVGEGLLLRVRPVALPEPLQFFLYLLVLVDFLLVGALHELDLVSELHQLRFDQLLGLFLVLVFVEQFLFFLLQQSQLSLQVADSALLLLDCSQKSLVSFPERVDFLDERITMKGKVFFLPEALLVFLIRIRE